MGRKSILKLILIAIMSIFAVFLVVIIVFFGGFRFPNKSNIVGFPNKEAYFFMSPSDLTKQCGDPNEIVADTLTPYDFYHYTENILGIESNTTYDFYRSPFGKYLTRTHSDTPVSSVEQGKDVVSKIYNQISDVYSGRTDYYNNGIKESNFYDIQYIEADLGIKHGATGIYINIKYSSSSNEVRVDVVEMS